MKRLNNPLTTSANESFVYRSHDNGIIESFCTICYKTVSRLTTLQLASEWEFTHACAGRAPHSYLNTEQKTPPQPLLSTLAAIIPQIAITDFTSHKSSNTNKTSNRPTYKILTVIADQDTRQALSTSTHRVYMKFSSTKGGTVGFFDKDLNTIVGPVRPFDLKMIRALVSRNNRPADIEIREMLELAISAGGGEMYLELTRDQYSQLKNGIRESF